MTEELKKRLIGASVLASLAVIFIPMLLEDDTVIDSNIYTSNIPPKTQTTVEAPRIAIGEMEKLQTELDYGTTIKPAENTEVKNIDAKTPETETAITTTALKPRVGLSSWMIQVASFASRDNALRVVEQLRSSGFDTHMETAQVKNRKVFRVRVGPEIDRNNADKLAKQISKKFFVKARVIKYP